MIVDFIKQTWGYREYLKQSVSRDLKNKYKRSVLGYCWTMLHPLAMMGVLSIVFSHVMRQQMDDYAIFLFPGMLAWNYFSSTSLMSLNSIRSNAKLFGQVPIPKYIFVLSIAMSNLVNLILALVPLLLIMLILGRSIPYTILLTPIVLIPLVLFTVGVSLMLATSNVFFDDTLHLSEVSLQALYFLSPVLYPLSILPPRLVKVLSFNPLLHQINQFREIFYNGTVPNFSFYILSLTGSIVMLFIGLSIFKKNENKFLYFV